MYDTREEELNKIMKLINELNNVIIDIKKDIKDNNQSKSNKIIKYIENNINETEKSIKELQEPFLLVIMGSGNYGKSTLINSLLKKEVVKSNDTPNTWKLDLFIKSDNEKMEITYKDNTKTNRNINLGNKILENEEEKFRLSKKKISDEVFKYKKENNFTIKELKQYKQKQEENNLYKSEISQIKYYLKEGNLLNDFIIVDTPGLNQTLLKTTFERMKEYYIKADGVIWLIDACNIVSDENYKLIEAINKIDCFNSYKKNIIAVVNKMDVISNQDKNNITKVKNKVQEIYKNKFNDIVYISAKEALEGIIKDDYNLMYKSNIKNLHESIQNNFTNICKEKQIESKYKNLYLMKTNIINELNAYKRELYKEISLYNTIEFELNKEIEKFNLYIINKLKSIQNKDIYTINDLKVLKEDMKKLEIQCNLDLEKIDEVFFTKINGSNQINHKIFFTKSKNLVFNIYSYDSIYKNEYKKNNQVQAIVNKLTLKNSKDINNEKIFISNEISQKIINLKYEIIKNVEETTKSIKYHINHEKENKFKTNYLDYHKIKKHIKYLDDIEIILNTLG